MKKEVPSKSQELGSYTHLSFLVCSKLYHRDYYDNSMPDFYFYYNDVVLSL